MHTVRETANFSNEASTLLTVAEYEAVIAELAANPEKGVIIQGTGGVRKMRFAFGGRGKSGGARAIYFYFDKDHPIYALKLFAKNVKVDLTAREKKELLALTTELKAVWRKQA